MPNARHVLNALFVQRALQLEVGGRVASASDQLELTRLRGYQTLWMGGIYDRRENEQGWIKKADFRSADHL